MSREELEAELRAEAGLPQKKVPDSIARLLGEGSDHDDMQRLGRRMGDRKIAMEEQKKAEEIRIGVHEKIRGLRHSIPDGELENASEAVKKYITQLENLHVTIWCPRCEKVKEVPANFDEAAATAALFRVGEALRDMSAACKKMQSGVLSLENLAK